METQNLIILLVAAAVVVIAAAVLYGRYRAGKEKGRYTAPKGEKLHVTLESKDLAKTAQELLAGLGGPENVKAVNVDGTRLKVEINQYAAVNEQKLRETGVGGVIRPSKTWVHILVGEKAAPLKEALAALLEA